MQNFIIWFGLMFGLNMSDVTASLLGKQVRGGI